LINSPIFGDLDLFKIVDFFLGRQLFELGDQFVDNVMCMLFASVNLKVLLLELFSEVFFNGLSHFFFKCLYVILIEPDLSKSPVKLEYQPVTFLIDLRVNDSSDVFMHHSHPGLKPIYTAILDID
jgi:hypothetical protein